MRIVKLLTGIIASGKSTWAREHIDSNTFIVSKDKIREMIYGKYGYKTTDEVLVDNLAKNLVITLLDAGADIIIDECWDTMTGGARTRLSNWLKKQGADIDIIYFSSINGNVERRMKDNHGDISKYIWDGVKTCMLLEFEPPEIYSEKIDIGEIK